METHPCMHTPVGRSQTPAHPGCGTLLLLQACHTWKLALLWMVWDGHTWHRLFHSCEDLSRGMSRPPEVSTEQHGGENRQGPVLEVCTFQVGHMAR